MSETQPVERAQAIVDGLGWHPSVPATVTGRTQTSSLVTLEVTLLYQRAKPVCCAEPACYTPFLRPKALAALADALAGPCDTGSRPHLRVLVSCLYEDGYTFIEPVTAPVGATLCFDWPEES